MRRLKLASALVIAATLSVVQSAHAQAQAWEKLVVPGLTYRMEIDLSKPLVMHGLRWTSGSGAVRARVELNSPTLLAPKDVDPNQGRETLSNGVRRSQAIAAINGDFFPWRGNPLGCMLRDGELIALPYPARSTFAWGPATAIVTDLRSTATFTLASGTQPLTGLNREVADNEIVLFTNVAGYATATKPATHIIFTGPAMLRPGVKADGTVSRVVMGQSSVKLEKGEWAITGTGAAGLALNGVKQGDSVSANVDLSGADFTRIRNVVGGGPALIKGGKITIDPIAEKFSNAFVTDRHPRSAIGFTREGDVWLVTIDGRQVMSRGASLLELAETMAALGCVEAMNLDGGGSSQISFGSLLVNRPSDGEERPTSNGIYLFGDLPAATTDDMVIKGAASVVMGQPTGFTVIDQRGETVPNGEIIWSAKGTTAWVDQSGTLRPLKAGEVTLQAYCRGKVLSVRVNVVDA